MREKREHWLKESTLDAVQSAYAALLRIRTASNVLDLVQEVLVKAAKSPEVAV